MELTKASRLMEQILDTYADSEKMEHQLEASKIDS